MAALGAAARARGAPPDDRAARDRRRASARRVQALAQPQRALSSLNWTINFLAAAPATDHGWWLLASTADMARGGYSSQRMTIWNAAGDAVAEAMQGVAIFA
ncbi:MAG: hypothetical protein WDN44_01820 [Sphingomonas sp.]